MVRTGVRGGLLSYVIAMRRRVGTHRAKGRVPSEMFICNDPHGTFLVSAVLAGRPANGSSPMLYRLFSGRHATFHLHLNPLSTPQRCNSRYSPSYL